MRLVPLEAAGLRVGLEQAVDGPCLQPGALGEPLGGAAGGGGEQHGALLLLEDLEDAAHQGGLAGAGAACDHQQLAGQAAADGLALLAREGELLARLEPLERPLDVEGDRHGRLGEERPQPAREPGLGGMEGGEIDRRSGVSGRERGVGGQRLEHHLAGRGERLDRAGHRLLRRPEQLSALAHQAGAGEEDVTAVGGLAQQVEGAGLGPLGRIRGDAELGRDAIGALEADAVDVERQPVGVLAHHPQGIGAVALEDAHRIGGRHPVGLEEDHHLADLALLQKGALDLLAPLGADAADLGQALGSVLDHRQGLQAEALDQPLGEPLADSRHQPRAQVALDAGERRRGDGLVGRHLELPPPARVVGPGAEQAQALADLDAQQVAHRGHRLGLAGHREAYHAPGVFLVREDDLLQGAFEDDGAGRGGGGIEEGHRARTSLSRRSAAVRLRAAARTGRQSSSRTPSVAPRAALMMPSPVPRGTIRRKPPP
jgi:hypothetical protein